MGTWFIVQNPMSGIGIRSAALVREVVEKRFTQEGVAYEFHQTTGEEDFPAMIADALSRGFDSFAAVGGDWTIAGIANGRVGTTHPLGIIPTGTGNGLARELMIPFSLKKALDLIFGEQTLRKIDLIEAKGKYHILNISIGFTANVIHETRHEEKRKLGIAAYFLSGLREIPKVEPIQLSIEVDGKRQDFNTAEVLLVNCAIFKDPIIGWFEEIKSDDGELDLFIFPAVVPKNFLNTVWNFLRGRPKHDSRFHWIPVRESVKVESQEPVTVQSDGDSIGDTPVLIRLVPKALNVIVPAQG
ncbi:MAG: diacylglycerol kinase family lipid kinase [Anaerolineaceae bacterium]|nr:diacylglycerol kinase family lipid kinase [Anaerolineaceae bacterium]